MYTTSRRLTLPSAETASSESSVSTPTEIVVNGASVSLDTLGPIVINRDGSLARINNWHEMAQSEKDTTLRVIAKRNKQRLDILKAQGATQLEAGATPVSFSDRATVV